MDVGSGIIMSDLEKYLPEEIIPHGLRDHLAPLFDEAVIDPKSTLNRHRDFLERLLSHLSILEGVQIREIPSRIEKLTSAGAIDHQIAPYFHFWWSVSCLGSHFQSDTSPVISWRKHLKLCCHAASTCILWYLWKYPPLSLTEQVRQDWLEDASTIFPVPFEKIEVCRKDDISERLNTANVLVFHGPAWVGKTSIGSYFVTDLCNQGYIPLVIHENSLVTFRILPGDADEKMAKNLRLATNAQLIHEIISPRLLHGDSFVILLDDPFGHRRYHRHNPLMFLRFFDWLELASDPHSLGSLKIIITTSTQFLIEGRRSLEENGKTNPLAKDNLSLLDDDHSMLLEFDSYNKAQLLRIVESTANFHECEWSTRNDWCDLIVETLRDEHPSFDALHVLCRDLKTASEDRFLDSVSEIAASADVKEDIGRAADGVKVRLCAAYVGEALIEFYRDFAFQTKLSFDDICKAGGLDSAVHSIEPTQSLSDWLLHDRVSTLNLSQFPVFTHPEVRAAVATLAETTMASTVHDIIIHLCGISETSIDMSLARWEAIHLICRLPGFITEKEAEYVNDQMFVKSLAHGGDPRNILWAIIGNWHHIRGSAIEKHASGFVKALPHSFKALIRPFIWEVTENWTHMGSEIRLQVLKLTGKGESLEELIPSFDDYHTLSFLAAGITNYAAIQESTRAGCDISEKYLDFMNVFVSQIAKATKRNSYTSRKGDGLFNAPGSHFNRKDVLEKLMDLGFRCGTLNDDHPLARQMKDLLSQQ